MNEKDGGPAFPGTELAYPDNRHDGMSLRDYFAGQALVRLSIQTAGDRDEYVNYRQMAANAYTLADAMLAERNKP